MSQADSNQLRSVQTALFESEAQKSALLRASLGAILTMDGSGRVVEANRAAELMFGFQADEIVGRPMVELIVPPESREAHVAGVRRILQGGEPRIIGRRVELIAQRTDGSRFPVELAVARIDAGARTLFTGFIHDLSERKNHEAELLEQRALVDFERDVGLTLSTTHDLGAMLDRCAQLTVRYVRASFARIWTLERDNVLHLRASAGLYTHLDGAHSRIPLGKFKIGLIAQEQKAHLTNAVVGDPRVHDQEWAEREGMVAFAGYPLLVEGRTVGVLAVFAKHELSESTLRAMQAVSHPIAISIERKRIGDELMQRTEALMRADQRKDEFLAMLGHELRNPIQVVRNCVELLRTGSGAERELEIVDKQVSHLTRLVDDILDLASVVRGQVKLALEQLSLEKVVRESADSMRAQLEKLGQELVFQSDCQGEVFVLADEVRLVQVITNLINNASKYSPANTRVAVTISSRDDEALVQVSDEGIGIESGFLPRVFEMFSQADQALERKAGGLGLGLPLARRIVEQHGGTIQADSAGLGWGSTFTIRLKRVAALPAMAAPEKPAADGRPRIQRVLVVDDNHDSAESVARLFEVIGQCKAEVAFDGPEALEKFERFEPELVLLDIGLPGIDGYEVARRMRAQPLFARTLLVALTGYGELEDRARSIKAGFDQHLVKPLERNGILKLLRGEA